MIEEHSMRKDASSTAADGTMFERYHTQFYRERELRTMRPIIGIPCFAAARAGTGRQIYGCNQAYVRAVGRAARRCSFHQWMTRRALPPSARSWMGCC